MCLIFNSGQTIFQYETQGGVFVAYFPDLQQFNICEKIEFIYPTS